MNTVSFGKKWSLIAVLGAAAVLRITLLAEYLTENPLATIPMVDAKIHHETAIDIIDSGFLQERPFLRPPLYAYFLAAVYKVFGTTPTAATAVQAAFGIFSILLLYLLARRFLSHTPSLVAAGLYTLYGPAAFFELKLLPASISVTLVLLHLLFLCRFLDRKKALEALVAGLAGGVLVLARPNLALIPFLTILWFVVSKTPGLRKGAAALLVGTLAAIAPVFAHNLAAGDCTAPVCAGGGLNFYLGNRQGAEVSFSGGFENVSDPAGMHEAAVKAFTAENGEPPKNLADAERFWILKGVGEIQEAPVSWLVLEIKKLKAFLSEFEYGINYSYAAEKKILTSLHMFIVPFALIAALGIAGAFLSFRIREKESETGSRALLLLVLAAVLFSNLLFFTYSRFRLPAVPVLCILSAGTIWKTADAFRKKRSGTGLTRKLLAFIAGAVACFIALLPPGECARRQTGAGHALVGAASFMSNRLDKAANAYERSIETDPGSYRAMQTLAGIQAAAGNHAKAWENHSRALELCPEDPAVLVNAAIFCVTAPEPVRDLNMSKALATKAIEAAPDFALSHLCLGMVLNLEGSEQEADKAFKKALQLSGGDPLIRNMILHGMETTSGGTEND